MSPSKVLKKIAIDRIAWVERMVNEIRSLSLASLESFRADARNV
jgi:hypothetical protein